MNIVVYGCCGRMGKEITYQLMQNNQLAGAIAKTSDNLIGQDVSNLFNINNYGIKIEDKLDIKQDIDCVIDMTNPDSSLKLAQILTKFRIPHVIGTTGFTSSNIDEIKLLAKSNRIFLSYNMSMGVNILLKVLSTITNLIDDDCDINITDIHHTYKKDQPSGTALSIANELSSNADKISFNSIRAGNIIGDHKIMFTWRDEIIEINHRALDKSIFAKGAIKAANWLVNQPNGFYSMKDIL